MPDNIEDTGLGVALCGCGHAITDTELREIEWLCRNEIDRGPCWGQSQKRLFALKRILDKVEGR